MGYLVHSYPHRRTNPRADEKADGRGYEEVAGREGGTVQSRPERHSLRAEAPHFRVRRGARDPNYLDFDDRGWQERTRKPSS